MTPNLAGLIAAALCFAATIAISRVLEKRSRGMRWWTFVIFGLLSIPAILFAVYYLHILPEREWFYDLRSWRGSEFLVVFMGAAAGALATLSPAWLGRLALFGAAALALVPHLKPMIAPIADSALADRWSGDVCLQSTGSTCGPASICTILNKLGAKVTERDVARAAFSYGGGTEAWYLARYIRAQGFNPRFAFRRGFSPEVGLPAMIGTRLGTYGHFVAVLAVQGDQLTVADPLRGPEEMPVDEFHRRYRPTGFHLVIEPGK